MKMKTIQGLPKGRAGADHSQYIHGMCKTSLYKKWSGIKRRCTNKNDKSYTKYGAKGVTICEKWKDFLGFQEDMGKSYVEGLSIDRIDNSKGYSKENCRWIPLGDQSKNRGVVKLYTFDGLT